MQRESWFLISGLLVTGAACAHHRGGATEPGAMHPAAVYLNVTNNSSLPMVVYAVGSGISYRLGTVSPGIFSRYTFPASMIGNGPLEVQARPSGGGVLIRSGQLLLSPGQVVDFKIEDSQVNSTTTVRP
jgi:hypothetical protein